MLPTAARPAGITAQGFPAALLGGLAGQRGKDAGATAARRGPLHMHAMHTRTRCAAWSWPTAAAATARPQPLLGTASNCVDNGGSLTVETILAFYTHVDLKVSSLGKVGAPQARAARAPCACCAACREPLGQGKRSLERDYAYSGAPHAHGPTMTHPACYPWRCRCGAGVQGQGRRLQGCRLLQEHVHRFVRGMRAAETGLAGQ